MSDAFKVRNFVASSIILSWSSASYAMRFPIRFSSGCVWEIIGSLMMVSGNLLLPFGCECTGNFLNISTCVLLSKCKERICNVDEVSDHLGDHFGDHFIIFHLVKPCIKEQKFKNLLTLLVPYRVTSKICLISFAYLHARLNSSLSMTQNRALIAFALLLTNLLSLSVHWKKKSGWFPIYFLHDVLNFVVDGL